MFSIESFRKLIRQDTCLRKWYSLTERISRQTQISKKQRKRLFRPPRKYMKNSSLCGRSTRIARNTAKSLLMTTATRGEIVRESTTDPKRGMFRKGKHKNALPTPCRHAATKAEKRQSFSYAFHPLGLLDIKTVLQYGEQKYYEKRGQNNAQNLRHGQLRCDREIRLFSRDL